MPKSVFLLLLLFISATSGSRVAFGQKEANIWHFGNKAGINFNTNPPQALYGNKTNTYYSPASIADAAGNLLFYFDGLNIFDRRYLPMPNNGFSGSVYPDNSLIVPWPGQPQKYFLFSNHTNSEVYSVIDMSLNNGFGNVESKNNFLQPTVRTDIVGVQHQNKRDFWVVYQENRLDGFKSYLVSPAGLNVTPVVSQVSGLTNSNPVSSFTNLTDLKASPDGTILAFTTNIFYSRGIHLLNFNQATGQISLNATLPDTAAIALEYSPDGTKLYCLRHYYSYVGSQQHVRFDLVQYDLTAGTPAGIFASALTIYQSSNSRTHSNQMQVGPNGQIYITDPQEPRYLHVIERPHLRGLACQFSYRGFDLDPMNTGQVSVYGTLPTFIKSLFNPSQVTIQQTCANNYVVFSTGNNLHVDSIKWNFGDPGSGNLNTSRSLRPRHFYAASGTYKVNAIVYINYFTDTINQTVYIPPSLAKPNLGPDRTLCPGESILLNAFQPGASYQWQDGGTTGPAFTVTEPGTYWVKVSNSCNIYSDSIRVNGPSPLPRFQDTTMCIGDSFILKAPPGIRYRWSTADTTRQITITKAGNYYVEVETKNGCFTKDSVIVKEERCFKTAHIANIITPNNDNLNDRFEPKGLEAGSWDLTIYNRWGVPVYRRENYRNEWPETQVNDGTYYYILRNKTSGKTYKGWVEVVR